MSTARVTRRPFTKCPASFRLKVSGVNTAKLVKGGELITDLNCDNLNGEFILNYSPCSSGPRAGASTGSRYQDELVWHTGCDDAKGVNYETAYISIDVPLSTVRTDKSANGYYTGVYGIECGGSYVGLFLLKSPTHSSCYSKAVWVSTSQPLLVDGSLADSDKIVWDQVKEEYVNVKRCSFYDAIPLGLDSALTGSVSKPICGGNSVWSIKYFGGEWSLFAGGEVYLTDGKKISPAIYTIFDSRGSKINMESFVRSPSGTKATAKLTQVNAGYNWPKQIPMKLQLETDTNLSVLSNTPIWTLSNTPMGSDRYWILKPRSNIGYPYYQSVSPENPDEICDVKTIVMQRITVPSGSKSSVSWCVNAPGQVTLKALCGGSGRTNPNFSVPRSGTTGLIRNQCGCVCDIDIIDNRIGSCTCGSSVCLGYCDGYSQSRIECKFPRSLDQCTMCLEDTAPCGYTALFGCEIVHEGWSIASKAVTLRKDCAFQPAKCTWYAVGPSLSTTGEGGTGAQPTISGRINPYDSTVAGVAGGCLWSGWVVTPIIEGPEECAKSAFGKSIENYTFEFDWPETRVDQVASTITAVQPCTVTSSPSAMAFRWGSGDPCSHNYYVGVSAITSYASRCRMRKAGNCLWFGIICGFDCIDMSLQPTGIQNYDGFTHNAQPLGGFISSNNSVSSGVECSAYFIERVITGGGYYLVLEVLACNTTAYNPNPPESHYYRSTKVFNSVLDLAEPVTCNLIRKVATCIGEIGQRTGTTFEQPSWDLRGIPATVSMIPTLLTNPCSRTSLLCDNPQNNSYGTSRIPKSCWYPDPITIDGFDVKFMGTTFSFDSYSQPQYGNLACFENQYRRFGAGTDYRGMYCPELKDDVSGDWSTWLSCNVKAKCVGAETAEEFFSSRLDKAYFVARAGVSVTSYMDPRPWHGGYGGDYDWAVINVSIYAFLKDPLNNELSNGTIIDELKAALSLPQSYPSYARGITMYNILNPFFRAIDDNRQDSFPVFTGFQEYYIKDDSWTESQPSRPNTYTERMTHSRGATSITYGNGRFRTHAEIKLPSTFTIS